MEQRPIFVDFEDIERSLKNEKTVIGEPLEEERLVKFLCPVKPNVSEIINYETEYKLVQRFFKEINGKIKSNPYFVVFDEFRTRGSRGNHIVLDGSTIEVLLPLRRGTTMELVQIYPENFTITCPGKDKLQKMSNEIFESLWMEHGMKWLLCPKKVCNIMYLILLDVFQAMKEDLKEYISLITLDMDTKANVLISDIVFNKEYLNSGFAEKHGKSEEVKKKELVGVENFPCLEYSDQGKVEHNQEDLRVRVRIIPSVTINVKEKSYLITQIPWNCADVEECHTWYQDTWWKEQELIDKICAADRCTRLLAAAGILRLSRGDPNLDWLTPMHLKHNLLDHIDQSLDNIFLKWQRSSLFGCFYDQLEYLRNQLQNQRIVNYFNADHNLIDRKLVDSGKIRKCVNRLNLLLRSRLSLIKTMNDAI